MSSFSSQKKLDTTAVRNTTDTTEQEIELVYLKGAVNDVKTALTICADCPLLAACKAETARLVDNNAAPCGVVRAGIYWGYNGRPDPTLNGCLTEHSAAHIADNALGELTEATITNDTGDEFPKTIDLTGRAKKRHHTQPGFIDEQFPTWDYTWIPPLSTPINELAVQAALSQDPHRPVVTERWLSINHRPINSAALRAEVLTDADVCEVIRRADATGIATRRLATILRMKWDFVQRLRSKLGISVPETSQECHTPITTENFDHQWEEADPWQQLALL